MSFLIYDIPVEVEFDRFGKGECYAHYEKNIPYFNEIKNWLPKEWDKCHIERTFDGVLTDKVLSTKMRCFEKKDGTAVARVTITFVEGFRLSEKRRASCWEQLDAQMSDGFGESYDGEQIPNAPQGYTLYF